MEASTLLRKERMDCPLCDNNHEVEERKRITSIIIKGEKVLYEERFYLCVNADEDENEFATSSMMNQNLLNARNAYRKMKGLLTSDEIVDIRESYGLSQVDMAKLLGWGEATISRYESKAIQDEVYDIMLRLIRDDPLQALEMLKKNKDKFTDRKVREIRSRIYEKMDLAGKEYLTRQSLKGEYAYFDEPSDSNGYTVLNIDKIEMIVSYIAENIADLFKVKLMKILWYCDAMSYKMHGHAMTGLVYCHDQMGALPIGHYCLMNLEYLNVREEMSANYDSIMHIYPNSNIDYANLSDIDKYILDKVIQRFKGCNTRQIVDYMHEEIAYKSTYMGSVIPFSLAAQIRDF